MTVTRRDVLRLAAAAAAAPLIPTAAAGAATGAAPAVAAGRFFGAAELALLDELAETLIPADEHSGGAKAAKVAAFIDGRLAEYDATIPDLKAEQDLWKAGLSTLDAFARETTGKGFVDATPDERAQVFTKLVAAERDARTAAEKFFVTFKEWTAFAYYTSSVGIHDEMQYQGNTLLPEFAGSDPE